MTNNGCVHACAVRQVLPAEFDKRHCLRHGMRFTLRSQVEWTTLPSRCVVHIAERGKLLQRDTRLTSFNQLLLSAWFGALDKVTLNVLTGLVLEAATY